MPVKVVQKGCRRCHNTRPAALRRIAGRGDWLECQQCGSLRPVTPPMDLMKLLQACERASGRGVPFTMHADPRYPAMRLLEGIGAVKGTRHADLDKTFWSITTAGETMLANVRAQAARDLAEAFEIRGRS